MRKTLLPFLFLTFALYAGAQVNVNFQVDITPLVNKGTQILPAGMRIAGTFATVNASVSGTPMVNWTPGDTTGRLSNLGNNIWGTTVSFPDSDALKNDTLQFKFVDGTWNPTGANEGGVYGDDSLINGGCAPASGSAKGNRLFVIPATGGQTYRWCYDYCAQCNGKPALIPPLPPVTVTLQVDVTRLIAEQGGSLLPAGMRVAGNFGTLQATVAGAPMVDWTPGDTSSRMTNIGNNIWSTTITFPDSDVLKNDTLQFKFVDGAFNPAGNNEDRPGDDSLVQGGCAPANGAAKDDRLFVIPSTSGQTYRWCYDHCTQCDGTPPLVMLPEVAITFQVDISRLITAGVQILPAGMRIAGNFGTLGANVAGRPMVNWMPGDTTGQLINEGNYVWATTVNFPDSDAIKNDTLQFKFVNGTWSPIGSNEDGPGDDSLVQGGCAPAGGTAKDNRLFVIPSVGGQTYQWCYDHCTRCDGTPALAVITGAPAVNNKISVFSLAPNPAVNGQSILMYSVNEYSEVNITLYNMLGQELKTFVNINRPAGIYNQTIDLKGLDAGIYIIRLESGTQTITRRIVQE